MCSCRVEQNTFTYSILFTVPCLTIIHEDSAAYEASTSSLTMEMETVTHALCWIALGGDSQTTHAIILADFKSLLQNSEVEWEAQTGMCQCSTSTFEKFDQHWKLFQGQHWENS